MTIMVGRTPPTPLAAAMLLGVLAAAAPAAAQRTAIDELRPLRPGATVSIEVITHTIVVQGWDRNEIQIVGEYDPEVETLDIHEDEHGFHFEIDTEGRRGRGFSFGFSRGAGGTDGRLEVRVPRGARVELATVSGDVTVSGFIGVLDASAVSGRVEANGNLASAELSAVGGRVSYSGNAPLVRLERVSGSVSYTGTARNVRLKAVSGSVVMEGGAETIEAESVSGAVQLRSSVPARSLNASSVSGRACGRREPLGRRRAGAERVHRRRVRALLVLGARERDAGGNAR